MFNWLFKKQEKRSNPPTPLSLIDRELGEDMGLIWDGIQEETALHLAPVFCAINTISQAVGTFDLYTFNRTSDGGRVDATNSPVYNICLNNPNPESIPQTFWETYVSVALLWGNSVAEIQRRGDGSPFGVWQIPPQCLEITRDEQGLAYVVKIPGQPDKTLRGPNVLHISGLSPDGSIGYQLVQLARQVLTTTKSAEDYTSAFFANSCNLSLALKIPVEFSDEAKTNLIKQIKNNNTGVKKAFKVLPLFDGVDVKEISTTNQASQLDESRKTNAIAVCQYFNLPIHKMKLSVGDRPGGNIEAENLSFLTDTLKPWLRKIAQECTKKLCSNGEFCEHDTSNYLSQYMFSTLQIAVNGGWILKSEAREWIGLNPIQGIDDTPTLNKNDDNGNQISGNTDNQQQQ